jgi:hypothetical protein
MSKATARTFAALKRIVSILEGRFLTLHLDQAALKVSRKEHVDVSAYVVLAHAAIEGYLEATAQWVLDRAVANWTKRKRLSTATACLLLSYECDPKFDGDIAFDRIRKALDGAKSSLSKIINADNHDISLEHMRRLFVPLGVDVPQDQTLLASLDKLAKQRGAMAHTDIGATVLLSA